MLDGERFIVLNIFKTKVGAIKKAMWKWWETENVISLQLQLQFKQLNRFWYFIVVAVDDDDDAAVVVVATAASALYMKRSTAEYFSTEMKMCNWNQNV